MALFLISISLTSYGQSNKFWSERTETALFLENTAESNIFPAKKRAFDIDFHAFAQDLKDNAPQEFTSERGHLVNLPLPNGGSEWFEVFYSPVVEQGLQDKYPNIRSYRGKAVNHPTWITRMTVSHLGLKASIKTESGELYIDPFIHGQTVAHAVYNTRDYPGEVLEDIDLGCGNTSADHSPLAHFDLDHLSEGGQALGVAGEAANLRTYRLAIATTGEWTLSEGGQSSAMARVIASVDRLNQVYENEVGVRLILIANNDIVVFADPDTDPYTEREPKSGRTLIAQNTNVLNSIIGGANYDVGHVFTNRCSDVGGVASLASVCAPTRKGSATTCWYQRNLEYITVRVFAHEMGHQFAATHTMNLCDNDNETLVTGFEPGSGSTIMSYGGLCGSNNVVSGSSADRDITYFHANSVMRMYNFSRGTNCGSTVATNNTKPEAIMEYSDGFTIPIRTPFWLEGMGVDMEGDNLTYCFEQHDAASKSCQLGQPSDECPAFRSYPPNQDDYRVFPRFTTIWNNQTFSDRNEVPVDYSRELNFVLTVRDNNSEAGAFGMDTVTFFTDENSGPFSLTYPNNAEEQVAGDIIEIKWDVANTDQAPVSCKNVDILLYNSSTWGDYTVLKQGTENDGSEWVTMPETPQTGVRIMIVASDNIFFDISNRNFNIVAPADEGYAWGLTPNSADICLPDVFTTEVFSTAFGGFAGSIDLEVTDGLPAGATYDFTSSSIEADQSTTLTIDLTNVNDKQDAVIEVRGIGSNGDTLYRNIELTIVSNDFSALTLDTPTDGVQGIGQSPSFEWTGVADADAYNVQLATSPAFDDPNFAPGSIIEEWEGVTNTSVSVSNLLEKNTIYYWRVQPVNVCGEGPWSEPKAFSTEAASCAKFEGQDRNINVLTGRVSEYYINIDQDAEINDLNISNFDFFCDFLSDAKISLVSPDNTEVLIADKKCGNTTEFLCSLDDDAPTSIRCPPNTGNSYRPDGKLSDFNGKSALGRWTLKLDILRSAVSANLGGWELEICANTVLDQPFLVNNDTMKTRPNENNPIRSVMLLTQDNNNVAGELEYTITVAPVNGEIILNGEVLTVGSTFTQEQINSGAVRYNQTSGENDLDSFKFTVNDGEGGWTGTHTFNINANEDFASSVNDLSFERLFTIFPNPTSGRAQVVFNEATTSDFTLEVVNLQGKTIRFMDVAKGTTSVDLNLRDQTQGVYLIRTQNEEAFFIEKLTLQSK
jgi:hypothetical protein